MFPIYLLEDSSEQIEIYSGVIKNTVLINDLSMELVCKASSPDELLNSINQNHQGLFFLDMEIDGEKEAGLKAAVEIRRQIPTAQIVFITTHDELSFLTLERKVAPLDYILKERGIEHIKQNINDDILKVDDLLRSGKYKKENIFTYHIGSRYFTVPISELIYLSTSKVSPGRVKLRSIGRESEFIGNLNDISEKYPMLFRCDKSYLVNLDLMESFDSHSRELRFVEGSVAYASIRKARELAQLLK
ncbi:response regulator transcription factor [Xylocopilactobacillus apis]|uniref:DNA-binding response regulator n=1 Tax=Xylocopilactobacillus apis TaxID=2932183 RepID=A0AAU9DES5_9LACO|nr:LytTR family transcriptional regulator DNA-binding domain-containing protein [Xylocopilactobacillus apis]BDR56701.1 DNA-binding response regulator [Xylocopilactobacillus apis]